MPRISWLVFLICVGLLSVQVTDDTVKLVVWFDNEYGHANRILDLVRWVPPL